MVRDFAAPDFHGIIVVMDYTGMLIVAVAFNVAVCALVAASYCRSRHRQVLADDLKEFCDDPTAPETCAPKKKLLHVRGASDRIPAL
jgi:hypothetical protein